MSKIKLKNIIFDFDGVIADTHDMVYEIFKKFDKDISKNQYHDIFDTNINEHDKQDVGASKDFFEYFFKEYIKNLNSDYLYKNADNILRELVDSGYKLYIISSNSEKGILKFLKKNNLEIFEKVLGYETNILKVKKFKILEKTCKINTNNSIFITDTVADIKEGHEVGCKVLAETFGYHDRERLEKETPEWIVDSWEEIIEVIKII